MVGRVGLVQKGWESPLTDTMWEHLDWEGKNLHSVKQGGWVVSLSAKVGELPDIGQLGDSQGEGETQPGGDVLGWWVGYFWEQGVWLPFGQFWSAFLVVVVAALSHCYTPDWSHLPEAGYWGRLSQVAG